VIIGGKKGYPEGHADSLDKENDIEFLWEKQQAGADFVVTQLFYDTKVFIDWYRRCRARGTSFPSLLSLPELNRVLQTDFGDCFSKKV